MSDNWRQSEICIVINEKSQDSTTKHLSCDGLLHYKFITQFARGGIFKIGEHLAKLQVKRLIVSCVPFSLDFCPQRCGTRRISETLVVVMLIGRLMCVYYQQISNCFSPVLTYWLTD